MIAAKYDGSRTRGGPGRPATRGDKVKQLLTMARENPSWGYTRLRGARKNLGFDLGRSTIQRILTEHGIEPAPLRGRTMPWKTFLKAHWGAIAAADFFSVEVLTRGGLVRYLVLFVIDLKTRRVHIAGVTCAPDGAWMAQVARNLTDAAGPLTASGTSSSIGIRSTRRTSGPRCKLRAYTCCACPRSPNLSAYAERFVRSIKGECLRHIVPLGERHLRAVLREFVEHYHAERNHQGLGNVIPFPSHDSASSIGRIRRRERLGGVLSFYERSAA
jgi:putative transposase